MRAVLARLLVLVVLVSGLPCFAAAQDAEAEARARFEAGRIALAAGHAESALADFRAAYELSQRPELLYNIGVAADWLRHDSEALEAFERYLAEMPADQITNRAEVEARVVTLRAELAEAATAPAPSGPDVGSYVLVGVGGAVLVAGIVVLVVGALDRVSVEGAPIGARWADYESATSRAPILEVVGGAAIGVGAALVIGGVAWLATPSGSSERPQVTLRTRGIGLSLEGTF